MGLWSSIYCRNHKGRMGTTSASRCFLFIDDSKWSLSVLIYCCIKRVKLLKCAHFTFLARGPNLEPSAIYNLCFNDVIQLSFIIALHTADIVASWECIVAVLLFKVTVVWEHATTHKTIVSILPQSRNSALTFCLPP